MSKRRAIVYIDGFNLYFGLKASVMPDALSGTELGMTRRELKKRYPLTKRSYWLDIQKLATTIIRDADLETVKYFTARITGNHNKQLRQNAFLNAIQVYCPKLKIFEGRYLLRRVLCSKCRKYNDLFVCPSCQHANVHPEEKKSDVNIATQMLLDAYENRCDIAYLVSGDSDFVPPIKAIRSMNSPKVVAVAFPPKQGRSKELQESATFSFPIPTNMIKKSWLPDRIPKPDRTFITIPQEWQ